MKNSKAAIGAAHGGDVKTVKKLVPNKKQAPDQQAEAFLIMAGTVKDAVSELAVMMFQQQQKSDELASELREENKILKDGFLVMQHELKALRERAVRLKPVANADGSYEYIDVIPLQKKTHLNS